MTFVLKKIPPMVDGSDSYSKYLLEQSEKENEEVFELDEITIKGEEYKAIKSEIEELEKKKKLIEQEILKVMNKNSCKKAKAGDYKFSIVTIERSSIDKKKMELENPEIMKIYKEVEAEYTIKKASSYLKVS